MRLACVVTLLACLSAAPIGAPQDAAPLPIRALMALYDRGDYRQVESSLAARDDLGRFRDQLVGETRSLRRGDGFDRRLMVAATLALEAVAQHGPTQQRDALELLEAGCELVRLNDDPDAIEHVWHRAAIALFGGLANGTALEAHAEHALERFPGDAHFLLARAVAAELRSYPDIRGTRFTESDLALQGLIVVRFSDARQLDATRAEATLRLGSVFLRAGSFESAISYLREAITLATDPELQYLAALFLGRALELQNRLDEAASAYEVATIALPGAQTAAIALAAALARLGRGDLADRVAGEAVAPGPLTPDPWLSYGQGDLRRLPALLTQLREALR